MKNQIFIASVISMAVLGLSACSSSESITDEQQKGTLLQVSASVGEPLLATRTTSSDGGYSYSWEITDYIGITGNLAYPGNKPNVKYGPTAAGALVAFAAVTPANAIIADTKDTQKYSAYYPFGGTEGTENNVAVTIGVNNTTDYMYAPESWTDYSHRDMMRFVFSHRLAKLAIKVTSDGTTAIAGATWKIISGIKGGSIVPSTGVVTLADAVTADMNAVNGATPILIPAQTINSGNIVITANGMTYIGVISSDIALTAGMYKVLTVTITESKLAITGSKVVAWTATDAGGNTHKYYTDNNVFLDSSGKQIDADFTPSGSINKHDYVQLEENGLKWATMNLGASKLEGYGDYYEWGATSVFPTTQGADYGSTVSWSTTTTWGYSSLPKDITAYGSNDVAYMKWGGATSGDIDRWTIPPYDDFRNRLLFSGYYTWTWGTLNGVTGYKVTCTAKSSTTIITTNKSLFFPVAGCYQNADNGCAFINAGQVGDYWTSTKGTGDYSGCGYCIQLESNGNKTYPMYCNSGLSVRPVSLH